MPSHKTCRLSDQQRMVLAALVSEGGPTPTTILRDVQAPYGYKDNQRWMKIGEPVGAVLRRLETRGLVTGERGRDCKDWQITDDGLEAMGWSRG
jgi:hypothetical protein